MGPWVSSCQALLVLMHHHPGIWVSLSQSRNQRLSFEGKKALDSDSGCAAPPQFKIQLCSETWAGAGGVSPPGLSFPICYRLCSYWGRGGRQGLGEVN